MSDIPDAPSVVRNRDAILQVLQTELIGALRVLEIGSGTGQHAIHFAAALPQLTWQTSDLEPSHNGIRHWISASGLRNVAGPMLLDVSSPADIGANFDVVFSANTAHIMSADAASAMLALTAEVLKPSGKFLLYGPFRVENSFSSESNEVFDKWLKDRDPEMGIRDLEWIDELAARRQLNRAKTYAMPANNLLAVWHKQDGVADDDDS